MILSPLTAGEGSDDLLALGRPPSFHYVTYLHLTIQIMKTMQTIQNSSLFP
jgi:hypothetical protein